MALTATELERLVVRLIADNSGLSRGLRQAEDLMSRTVANITSMGLKLSFAISAPLGLVGKMAVREFARFEDAMNKAFVVAGDVSEGLRAAMTEQARTMSTETVLSATELADAYRFLAASGMDATQSMESLGVVSEFAIAGLFDLEHATNMLVDAQNALGLKVDDNVENLKNMRRVADLITKAGVISTTDPQQIARAITTKAGAQLRVTNKSLEEGLAILSAFASVGVKAELAGEQLFMMLRDLQSAALRNAAAWEKYNIKVFDANHMMRNTADIIEDIERAFRGLPTEGRKNILMDLGITERSVAATLNLVGLSPKIRKFQEELEGTGDIVARMARENMQSFMAELTKTGNILTNLAITIGGALAPTVRKINEYIKEAVDWFQKLAPSVQEFLVQVGVFAAATGPVLLLVGVLAGPLVSALQLVAGAFVALMTPVGAVTAGVVALTAWLVGGEGLAAAWQQAGGSIGQFAADMAGKVLGFFFNFRENVDIIMKWFGENWAALLKDAWELLKIFVDNALADFGTLFETMVRIATVTLDYIFSVDFVVAVAKGLELAWDLFKSFFASITREGGRAFRNMAMPGFAIFDSIFGGGGNYGGEYERTLEDLRKRKEEGLGGALGSIISEQVAKLKLFSTEGFQSSIQEGMKLNLGIPTREAAEQAAKEALDGVGMFKPAVDYINKALYGTGEDIIRSTELGGPEDSIVTIMKKLGALAWGDLVDQQRQHDQQQRMMEHRAAMGSYDFRAMQYAPDAGARANLRNTDENLARILSKFDITGTRLLEGLGRTFREDEMAQDREKQMLDDAVANLHDIQAESSRVSDAKIVGSQAAAEAMLKAMFGGMTAEEKAAREQLRELKTSNKTLNKIEGRLQDMGNLEAANVA